jgi:tetratricopeptide (TPR) repeat protein
MAKTRRGRARRSSAERPKRRPAPNGLLQVSARPSVPDRQAPWTPPAPPPSHLEAVALYERGLEALQRKAFDVATATLREVLSRYPEEREIHERARLYLKVCDREMAETRARPETAEERLLLATVALNSGDYDGARSHLRKVQADDPGHDHAEYMLSIIAAAQGEHDQSLDHLRRAIELNPENRAIARQDPDLEALHGSETFRQLVEPVPGAPISRRRRPRFSR